MTMTPCDVRAATHVKLADGTLEPIESKWGISADGALAKPSAGGFGVVTASGKRVDMLSAHSYYVQEAKP